LPSATRTPTVGVSPSPTPSLTASPTASPTTPIDDPTALPSATATRQTPTTRRIYLPLASNVRCPTGRKPVDVVLVLDTSLSMDTVDTPGGPTRRAAATKAAGDFIDLLDLGRDRAGIVGFNDTASLAAALTGNRNRLRGALATLPAAPGTRIDRGLDAAASALLPVAPGRVPLVVLLTDGAADSAATADALVAAQRLHRAGVTVFVIGLGADVDSTLLLLVASRPGLYLAAPDPRELGAAFRAVAARIPCG
jgi:Mg-chelatase subunit ChlD